jgi:hypothetical protein
MRRSEKKFAWRWPKLKIGSPDFATSNRVMVITRNLWKYQCGPLYPVLYLTNQHPQRIPSPGMFQKAFSRFVHRSQTLTHSVIRAREGQQRHNFQQFLFDRRDSKPRIK